MTNSEGFLRSTAQDYDMTVEHVQLVTRYCETTDEFYAALESEIKTRSKINQPPLPPK